MTRLRTSESNDVSALISLAKRAWAGVEESVDALLGSPLDRLATPSWAAHHEAVVRDAVESDDSTALVAEDSNGQIAGFAAFTIHPESPGMSRYGEITAIAVDPAARRSGLGRRLLDHAVDQLRAAGVPVIMLSTGGDEGHAPARALYESAGFRLLPIAQFWLDPHHDRTDQPSVEPPIGTTSAEDTVPAAKPTEGDRVRFAVRFEGGGPMNESVSVRAAGDLTEAQGTPGIKRMTAFEGDDHWFGHAEAAAKTMSGWHHHGEHTTVGYILKGRIRLEFGPGGTQSAEVGPGEYFTVPPGAIHREGNSSDETAEAIVVRFGEGPPVFPADGPEAG